MQQSDQKDKDSFNEAVDAYRLGGRQEKKYIPYDQSQTDHGITPTVGFDPTGFLQQTPKTQVTPPTPSAANNSMSGPDTFNPFSNQNNGNISSSTRPF